VDVVPFDNLRVGEEALYVGVMLELEFEGDGGGSAAAANAFDEGAEVFRS